MRANGRLLTGATRIRVGLRYDDSIGTSIHATTINQGSWLTVNLLPCMAFTFCLRVIEFSRLQNYLGTWVRQDLLTMNKLNSASRHVSAYVPAFAQFAITIFVAWLVNGLSQTVIYSRILDSLQISLLFTQLFTLIEHLLFIIFRDNYHHNGRNRVILSQLWGEKHYRNDSGLNVFFTLVLTLFFV